MHAINIILYIVAAIAFGLAAAGVPSRVNLIAVGLFAWVLVPLIAAIS